MSATRDVPPADTRRLFDRDAGAYFAEKYGRHGDPAQQYAFAVRRAAVVRMLGPTPGHVLDVGCGPGVMIEPVLARGGRLTGLDLSPRMSAEAEKRAQALGLIGRCEFRTGSAEALPFDDDTFDAVTAMGVIEYVPDDGRALREMARVTRPGGVVIVTVPNLLSPWRFMPLVVKPPFLRFLKPAYRAVRRRVAPAHACELDSFPRRLYVPAVLDRRMARAGLARAASAFYNFRLPVIGTVRPAGSIRLAAAMAPLDRCAALRWIGGGYIAKGRVR